MRVGLIVNPHAGLGGSLGLRSSDGELADRALASGASPQAHLRAARALTGIEGLDLLTVADAMGETAARAAGLRPAIVHSAPARTTAADTVAAAQALCDAGVDLLLFAGGDGTARALVGHTGNVPVLGVPAGVKMHSAVFATSPAAAAAILDDARRSQTLATAPAAIIDRGPAGRPVLHGTLAAPRSPRRQGAKQVSQVAADADLASACTAMAQELAHCPLAIIGPGATMRAVKQALASDGTLLGVDAYAHGQLVARDADEATLWQLVAAGPAPVRLVLGVVGGQGFLLGRGNAQLSPRLLARLLAAGPNPISVLAGADKLAALDGGRLLVDSGDEALDRQLAGDLAVRTGPRRRMVMQVTPG